MSHRLGGNAISDAVALQSQARRAARRGLRFGTAAWSVIDIADSWKSNRQPGKFPPYKDAVYECHSSVPQMDEWKGSVRGGRAHKDSEEAQ